MGKLFSDSHLLVNSFLDRDDCSPEMIVKPLEE